LTVLQQETLMTHDEIKARLKGIFSIIVTPFTSDGAFDFPALGENIERVISLGYDGLLIGGTYGEFPAMSATERAELFRAGASVCFVRRISPFLARWLPASMASARPTAVHCRKSFSSLSDQLKRAAQKSLANYTALGIRCVSWRGASGSRRRLRPR